MRDELRAKLVWPTRDHSPEVLIIRLSRKDDYPSTDGLLYGLFEASPWFKREVKSIGDRDLEVFTGIYTATIRKGKARRSWPGADGEDPQHARKVFAVGRIPFERIAYIDWDPDPVYSLPRIYVEYGWRGPFREQVAYEESGWATLPGSDRRSLVELHDVKWQGEGGNPWRWVRSVGSRLSFSLEMRRQDRRDRRNFTDHR